jgi:hypothetical protein
MSKNSKLFEALTIINGVASAVTGMKTCIGCFRSLPVEDNFYLREGSRGMKGEYGSYCKECSRQKAKDHYRKSIT